jgi:hypothetical protein
VKVELPQAPLSGTEPQGADSSRSFGGSVADPRSDVAPRTITYEVGKEVRTPHGDVVLVLALDDDVEWRTADGGRVDPHEDAKFCRLRVRYVPVAGPYGGRSLAERFKVQLEDGTWIEPLDETYTSDTFQLRTAAVMAPGTVVEGTIYYELENGGDPVYAVFDCTDPASGEGIWLRWTRPADETSRLREHDGDVTVWADALLDSMHAFLATFPRTSRFDIRRLLHL